MSFNRLIVFVTWSAVLVGLCYIADATDWNSLLLVVGLLMLAVVVRTLWKLQERSAGREAYSALSLFDTWLAAIVYGLITGLGLALYVSAGAGVAWAVGLWTPTFYATGTAERAGDQLDSSVTRGTEVKANIEVLETFVRPPTLQIDVEIKNAAGGTLALLPGDKFELRLDRKLVEVEHIEPIIYEPALAVLILRDASASAAQKPFPELVETASRKLLDTLQATQRKNKVRVIDFSGECVEVIPWSVRPRLPGSLLPPPGQQADKSALMLSAGKAIDDLAGQANASRILVLIADGGNNVPAPYSPKGLAAYARSRGVVVHIVGLPTEHHNEAFLRSLAAETRGRYLDASQHMSEVGSLVAIRDKRRAYRVVAKHSQAVRDAAIDLSVRTRKSSDADLALRELAALLVD